MSIRILIINPNTTKSMTDALSAPIDSLAYNNTTYTYHTSPNGPASINSPTDAADSEIHTLPTILPLLSSHSAFLVACYSPHPLVSSLKVNTSKPVLGIFEASVHAALQLLRSGETFGIVSTGKIWEEVLGKAVRELLGEDIAARRFAGVETTGMSATELHEVGEEVVRQRVKEAACRLAGKGKLGVAILGCAGMVGMEEWVREEVGDAVRIVDGVKAGVGILQGLIRGGFE